MTLTIAYYSTGVREVLENVVSVRQMSPYDIEIKTGTAYVATATLQRGDVHSVDLRLIPRKA